MARPNPNRLMAVGLVWLACGIPVFADTVLPDAPALTRARQFEEAGRWDDALRVYCQLIDAGNRSELLRDQARRCLRHVLQQRRLRDDRVRELVDRMGLTESLDLYTEYTTKITTVYPDPAKATPSRLLSAGFEELEAALDDAAFRALRCPDAAAREIDEFRRTMRLLLADRPVNTPRDARALVRLIAREAERELGLDRHSAVVFEFLWGACHSLDEYSTYLTPGEMLAPFSDPELDLLAFGVRLGIRDGELWVIDIRQDSPAAMDALISLDDRVVAINGREVTEPTPAEVARMLRREFGESIELVLSDLPGSMNRHVTVPSELPTVVGSAMVDDSVGYLRLLAFRPSTAADLDQQIVGLQTRGMELLILDLRGNPGGGLLDAVAVAERFLNSGDIVTTQGRLPEVSRTFSSPGMGAWSFPVVLLIDGQTASAAEVLAASLKFNGRAVLIGSPTYGKGSLQTLIRSATDPDGRTLGAIRLTVAELLGPGGVGFDGTGVRPDIDVPTPEAQLPAAVEHASVLLTMMR